MKLRKKLLALLLSAVMLATPVLSLAEDAEWSIPAGEITMTAVSDDYVARSAWFDSTFHF